MAGKPERNHWPESGLVMNDNDLSLKDKSNILLPFLHEIFELIWKPWSLSAGLITFYFIPSFQRRCSEPSLTKTLEEVRDASCAFFLAIVFHCFLKSDNRTTIFD